MALGSLNHPSGFSKQKQRFLLSRNGFEAVLTHARDYLTISVIRHGGCGNLLATVGTRDHN